MSKTRIEQAEDFDFLECQQNPEGARQIIEALADALQAAAEREAKKDAQYWSVYENMVNLEAEVEKLRAEVARLGEEYRNAVSDNFRFAARIKDMEEGLRQTTALLEILKEHWIDYDHVFTIAVHDARQLLNGASDE